MTDSKESKFHAKLIYFIVIVLFLKLLYLVIDSLVAGNFPGFIMGLIILAVVFFVISRIINSLFGGAYSNYNGGYGGGTSTVGSDQFQSLLQRYEKLTDEFIEKKQFKKAAYIQLKLLKNPYKAASILRQGHYYNEAAHIYLKKCHQKDLAAECYEEARSYTKAIKLYKELEMNEKVGDLYQKINDAKKAEEYYQMVVDDYVANNQFVKAALLYRKKMNKIEEANAVLLRGWEENRDAINCANNYFANFKDQSTLLKELIAFKQKRVQRNNEYQFLTVLTHEYSKTIAAKEEIQKMAYELISKNHDNEHILSLLKHFVKDDTQLTKDILRHRLK